MMEIRITEDFDTRDIMITCLDLKVRPKVAYWVDFDGGTNSEEIQHVEVPESCYIPRTRVSHDPMQLGAWNVSRALEFLLPAPNLK